MRNILMIFTLTAIFFSGEALADNKTINDSNDWFTVNLNVGDTLTVILADDPEDGYEWALGRYDDDIIMLISGPQASAANRNSVTRFKALKSGTTSLLLRYNNSKGAGIQDIKAFQVSIVVSGAS